MQKTADIRIHVQCKKKLVSLRADKPQLPTDPIMDPANRTKMKADFSIYKFTPSDYREIKVRHKWYKVESHVVDEMSSSRWRSSCRSICRFQSMTTAMWSTCERIPNQLENGASTRTRHIIRFARAFQFFPTGHRALRHECSRIIR